MVSQVAGAQGRVIPEADFVHFFASDGGYAKLAIVVEGKQIYFRVRPDRVCATISSAAEALSIMGGTRDE